MSYIGAASLRIAFARPRAALALAVLAVTLAGPAFAQEGSRSAKLEAKARFTSGQRHYNLNELPEALADFKDAYRLYPDPVFLFNLGQCERQLGHHEEAIRFYRNFLREEPKAPNRPEVLRKIEEMEAASKSRPPEADKLASPPVAPAPEATTPSAGAAMPPTEEGAAPVPEAAASARAATRPEPAQATPAPAAPALAETPATPPAAPPASPGPAPISLPATAQMAPDEGQPDHIDLTSPAAQPAPAPAFYRRWWFWTGVAAIAIGAGLGIYAATADTSAPAPTTDLGTRKVF
jgi:hypothetical protein